MRPIRVLGVDVRIKMLAMMYKIFRSEVAVVIEAVSNRIQRNPQLRNRCASKTLLSSRKWWKLSKNEGVGKKAHRWFQLSYISPQHSNKTITT